MNTGSDSNFCVSVFLQGYLLHRCNAIDEPNPIFEVKKRIELRRIARFTAFAWEASLPVAGRDPCPPVPTAP